MSNCTPVFIKFIRDSEESDFLLEKYPNAFLLLCLIAKRARRVANHPDGLEIGQAYLGDHFKCGLTRQQYRTALNVLTIRGHITILENCRTRQKSTTGSTTVGTLVKLLSSNVWDINIEDHNHRINHRPTTDQPPTNHKEELKKPKELKRTTTPTSSFPKSQEPKKSVVVVFPIIEKLDIGLTTEQKIELSKFPLEHVQKCIDFILDPSFKPKKGTVDALFWAVRQKNAPSHTKVAGDEKERLEDEINAILWSSGYKKIVEDNQKIKDQGIMLIPCFTKTGELGLEQISRSSDQFRNDLVECRRILYKKFKINGNVNKKGESYALHS